MAKAGYEYRLFAISYEYFGKSMDDCIDKIEAWVNNQGEKGFRLGGVLNLGESNGLIVMEKGPVEELTQDIPIRLDAAAWEAEFNLIVGQDGASASVEIVDAD